MTSSDIARQLANAHTLFNVTNTCLFLPFTSAFVKLIQFVVPGKSSAINVGPQFLDPKLVTASPAAAIDAIKKEISHMGAIALSMLQIKNAFVNDDPKMIDR